MAILKPLVYPYVTVRKKIYTYICKHNLGILLVPPRRAKKRPAQTLAEGSREPKQIRKKQGMLLFRQYSAIFYSNVFTAKKIYSRGRI